LKVEIIAPDRLDIIYPFVASLTATLAGKGRVLLIDFTEGSPLNRRLENSLPLKGYYREEIGNVTVYYINVPVFLSQYDEIRTLTEMVYKELSGIEVDLRIVLFPTSQEITQVMLGVERDSYRRIFGSEESRAILAVGVQRAIISETPESPIGGIEPASTFIDLLYEPAQKDIVTSYEWKVDVLTKEGRYMGYAFVQVDSEIPGSFSSAAKFEGIDRTVEMLLKPKEKRPESHDILDLEEIPVDFDVLAVEGSAFSFRSDIVNSLINRETDYIPVVLNGGNFKAPQNARELQLMPGFSDERFKAKSVADVKGMAKRLAEEVINEAQKMSNVMLIVYETGNITPRVVGYDEKVVAHEFWKSFVWHLKFNIRGLKVILVCDPSVEACGPIEALSDVTVSCSNEQESKVLIRRRRA